jgi:hypothetical protein
MCSRLTLLVTTAVCLVSLATLSSQGPARKAIGVVSTAHLDSQWNWTVQDTIRDFIPEDVLYELRAVREVPELRLQLGRRDPLHEVS